MVSNNPADAISAGIGRMEMISQGMNESIVNLGVVPNIEQSITPGNTVMASVVNSHGEEYKRAENGEVE